MNKTKKLVSVLLSFVIMLSTVAFLAVPIQAAGTIKSIYSSFDWLDDEYDGSFSISRKSDIKFTFKSEIKADVNVYDENYDNVLDYNNTKSFTKTVTLDKGTYEFELVSDVDYDDENDYDFSLLIQDVTVYSTGIKFKSKGRTCSVGSKFILKPTLSPSGSIPKSISYTSSNRKVATVDKNGKLTAKGLGKCTITAKLNNGKKATYIVTVNSTKLYVFAGTTRTAPLINGKTKAKWKSSNNSIATVSGQKIKGVYGNAITKCISTVSKLKYTCYIYVVDYKTLYKDGVEYYKDHLKDPDSFRVYHIYRGYDSDGEACIVLDCGARNSYGGMVRDYCNIYQQYNPKTKWFVYNYYTTDHKIKLSGERKIK